LEYAPGEIPAMLTVLFLGSATISRFFDFIVIEALLAFLLLYLTGFIINAITDKEIDSQYDNFKTSIPKSVEILGERTLWGLIIGHVVVATILAFHISIQMNNFLPLILVLIGTFFGLGYSVKPFQFKVRGVWHAIALGSSAFFLPFIFLMFVVAEGIPFHLLAFIIGFSFVHYGMEFGNQAIDYVEDKAQNVRTPPVRWGMIPSLKIALACVFIGILTEGYSLYYVLLSKGSFTLIHPILETNVIFAILMGIILAGYYIPTKGLYDMLITLKNSKTVEEGMPRLKKICNYAKWQASGIFGVAIVSGIIFLGVAYGPVTQIVDDTGTMPGVLGSGMDFVQDPDVEFFDDGSNWLANVTVNLRNGNTPLAAGSALIEVQSWVANFPIKMELLLLDKYLESNRYWNVSTQILAHDIDDTTIKIKIKEYKEEIKDFKDTGIQYIQPSKKDLYIYNVKVEAYEDMFHNKMANVTVNVFNEGQNRAIGNLYLEVWYYYLGYSDYESAENDHTIKTNTNWVRTLTINAIELDEISEPFFVVNLYKDGDKIDELTIYGYD
jgi:4-hydroxybenzoate polyprenyltransferase